MTIQVYNRTIAISILIIILSAISFEKLPEYSLWFGWIAILVTVGLIIFVIKYDDLQNGENMDDRKK